MRILYLGNNWVGWHVLKLLVDKGVDIVGLVIHPEGKRRYQDEIIKASGLPESCIFDGSELKKATNRIKDLKPDIGVSVYFGYILKPEFLRIFPNGCINVHPALLPYNKGSYPNVWSIIDNTPAGVTIHYINEGVDTGDIISQKQVFIEPADTGKTLYHKLENTAVNLFKDTWPLIERGKAPYIKQNSKKGTYHKISDINNVDEIKLDGTYTGEELINILRARTFPPYRGAYFKHNGRKVYLRLELMAEEGFNKS